MCLYISILANPFGEGEYSYQCAGNFNLNCAVHHLFIAYTRNHSIARFNMDDQELQPVSKNSAAIKSNGATPNGSVDRDRADLMRLGKKPVLRVRLALAVKILTKTDVFHL